MHRPLVSRRGQKVALDTSGTALKAAICRDLELLKLSLSELEFLVGREAHDPRLQEKEVTALIHAGTARAIAVSLGRDGAILGTGDGVIRLPALPVQEQSAVGAGDAFLAGLVVGLARGMPYCKALALGTAAGAAAVTTYGTAQVQRATVDALYRQVCERAWS